MADTLKYTSLAHINNTIQLLKDRARSVANLKKLVFDSSLGAGEINAIQPFIENNYWLLGEKYHLVSAEEPSFEEALRRFTYLLTGEKKKKGSVKIDSENAKKQMDIFAVRQMPDGEIKKCIVVELKHPNITLSMKELNQVKTYLATIVEEPEFKAPNIEWEFYLIGNTYNDYIKREIENGIEYDSCGDKVSAYLLLPNVLENNPAILINHQHNRKHHLGKSEVCGLAGNPLQAFGPALARKGFVVLAPDSICFEQRCKDPTVEGFDFWQHFDEMCYRIITGDYLMKKVLSDAMNGITLLTNLDYVDKKRIGTLGHSYGGNTVLFLSALDERIAFSCASGSACTYKNRMINNVGIEMASVIPNFHGKYDIDDLMACIAPRRLLIVSSEDDKYSKDAPYIVEKGSKAYMEFGAIENLYHSRYSGGHAMTKERYDFIIEWIVSNAKK